MARMMKYLQRWLSRIGAAALLLSFAVATVLSVAHQADYDMYYPASAHVLTAQISSDSAETLDTSAVEIASCAAGFLCHVQLVPLSETVYADDALFLSVSVRPDPGLLLVGQTIDVLTPPPLPMRA